MKDKQYRTTTGLRNRVNQEIVGKLAQYLYENPTIRFGQALINLDILPIEKTLVASNDLKSVIYNEEPAIVLARMERR